MEAAVEMGTRDGNIEAFLNILAPEPEVKCPITTRAISGSDDTLPEKSILDDDGMDAVGFAEGLDTSGLCRVFNVGLPYMCESTGDRFWNSKMGTKISVFGAGVSEFCNDEFILTLVWSAGCCSGFEFDLVTVIVGFDSDGAWESLFSAAARDASYKRNSSGCIRRLCERQLEPLANVRGQNVHV
jgi:hypothetical protein